MRFHSSIARRESNPLGRIVLICALPIVCATLWANSEEPPTNGGDQPAPQGDDGGGASGSPCDGCQPADGCGFPASPAAANPCTDDDDDDPSDGGEVYSGGAAGVPGSIHSGGEHGTDVVRGDASDGQEVASASSQTMTMFPVYYGGANAERVTDYVLPSRGPKWVQKRYFNQSFTDGSTGSFSSSPTEQGFGWSYSFWSNLQQDGTDIHYWRDAHHSYTYHFASVSDGTAVWEADGRMHSRLTRNHTGDDPNSFRLEKPNGTIWLFYSFDSSIAAAKRGKLYKVIDPYRNELDIARGSSGEVSTVDDASGHHVVYEYSTIAGYYVLTTISVYATSTVADSNKLAKITYTYKASGTGHADCGTDGDLIQVKVERRATTDTSTTLSISDITSYRYFSGAYTDNSGNGKAHQLRYIFRPNETHRALTTLSNMIDPNNTAASPYASSEFAYYDSGSKIDLVRSETVHSGPLCCGGGGDASRGTYAYDYAFTGAGSPGRNDWYTQTKETNPDGSVRWVETNKFGEMVVSALFQVDGDPNKPHTFAQYKRDSDSGDTAGRVDRVYTNSAITSYNSSTHGLTYDPNGSVVVIEYEDSSKLYRFKQSKVYRESQVTGTPSSGEGEMLARATWDTSSSSCTYRQVVVQTKKYEYPTSTYDPNDPNATITQYDYLFWTVSSAITEMIQVCKITEPNIPTTQNGSGTATATYLYFDVNGYLRFFKNGRGNIRYYGYDQRNAKVAIRVEDICTTGGTLDPNVTPSDPNIIGWPDPAPSADTGDLIYSFTTTGSGSNFVRSMTQWTFDASARVQSTTAPDGQLTYVAYLDKERRVYPSWDGSKTRLPLHRTRTLYDSTGRRVYADTADPNQVTGTYSNPPTGGETWPTQANWLSLTKVVHDSDDQVTEVWRWFSIPSSVEGSEGTNYALTKFKYSIDSGSSTRSTAVEMRDPGDGWTATKKDSLGNVFYVGKVVSTSDPNLAADYTQVIANFYGEATAGSGLSRGGPLSSSREFFGAGGTDFTETRYFYDSHNRLKLVKSYNGSGTLVPPLTAFNYDNQNRVTATANYSADPNTGAATDAVSTTTNRVSLSKTSYDNLGRVFQTETDSIASDGTVNSPSGHDIKLVTRFFYDQNGLLVATDVPNGGVLISKPDGAGRVVESWACSQMDPNLGGVYSSGAFDYSNSNIRILEKTISTLNSVGDVIAVQHTELDHDQTGASGSTTSVATFTRNFYDAAGRLSGSAFYGTNNTDWSTGTEPNDPNLPARSDTLLVTSYAYDIASRIATVTDPKAIVTGYTYDNLDRVTQVTESQGGGGSDLNRGTKYTYDSNGNVKTIAAAAVADYNGDTTLDDQTTEYVRASTIDSDWVTAIHYPDPNSGSASSDPNNVVTLTFDNDGSVASRTDQIGTVITYGYDGRRRLEKQRVTTLTSPTDGTVRRIAYTYNNAGQLQLVSSYADPNTGSQLNEVALTYDGFGKLTKDEQAHTGATGSAPSVQYTYAHSSSSDESTDLNYFDRLTNIIYPNGRYVWYDYANHSTSGIGTINNLLSRVGRVDDGTSGGATFVIAEYSFNGLGRMVQRDLPILGSGDGKPGNNTALRMIRQTSDSGSLYPDFDRFGRITSMRHLIYDSAPSDDSATKLTYFNYGYDRNSNRTYAEFVNNKARSRIYGYDNLNRLTSDKLGIPKPDHSDVLANWTKPAEQDWTLDILGSWSQFNRKANDVSAAETRAHNATNEIKSRTPVSEGAKYWVNDALSSDPNDKTGWVTAAPAASSTWSIASSKLQCDSTASSTGCPIGGGNGAIYLIDQSKYQDFQISVSVTLSSTAENGGLIVGYTDEYNFTLLTADRGTSATRKYKLYHVTGNSHDGRTWTLVASGGSISSSGGTFSLVAEVRSGAIGGMSGLNINQQSFTIPAGLVGLWAGSASASVKFVNFHLIDTATSAEVNGLYFDTVGGTSVSSSQLQMTAVTGIGSAGVEKECIRRGFAGSKYVMEFDCPSPAGVNASVGAVVHWQNPENFMGVVFRMTVLNEDDSITVVPDLIRRKGGVYSVLTSGSSFTWPSGHRARIAIHDDPNNADLQEVIAYLDGTARLTSNKIDDDWKQGKCGLIVTGGNNSTRSFDNVLIGFDNSSPKNDNVDDGGDTIFVNDDFSSGTVTLAHDKAGNLTDDGVFKYVYDAWNRLVGVKTSQGANSTIATYAYDGLNRRISKVVTNTGSGVVDQSDASSYTGIQAGDKTENYYYAGWRVLEERDGSSNSLAQTVYGTRYIDEPICRDRNTDVGSDSDCDDEGGSQRYFYQQDANYRVVALTDEAGTTVERYEYEAYGEPRIYQGAGSGSELGYAMQVSGVGNSLMYQGLQIDGETCLSSFRFRTMHTRTGRFMQRDPLEYRDGLNGYVHGLSDPFVFLDPLGLCAESWDDWFKRMFPRAEKISNNSYVVRSLIILVNIDRLDPNWRAMLDLLKKLMQDLLDKAGLKYIEVDVFINWGDGWTKLEGGTGSSWLEHSDKGGANIEYVNWVEKVTIELPGGNSSVATQSPGDFQATVNGQKFLNDNAGSAADTGANRALSLAQTLAHEMFWHGMGDNRTHPNNPGLYESTNGTPLGAPLPQNIINYIKNTFKYP